MKHAIGGGELERVIRIELTTFCLGSSFFSNSLKTQETYWNYK